MKVIKIAQNFGSKNILVYPQEIIVASPSMIMYSKSTLTAKVGNDKIIMTEDSENAKTVIILL